MNRKGLWEYLGMVVVFLFAFILIVVGGIAGKLGLFQEQVPLQKSFDYTTDFSNLIGEANQLLYVNDFKAVNFDMNHDIIGVENVILDTRLYGWMSLYIHGERTNSNVFRFVNEKKDSFSTVELNELLEKRMSKTVQTVIPPEIFYSIHFEDIEILNNPDRKISALGKVSLPVIAPGEFIGNVLIRREETPYNLILQEVGR